MAEAELLVESACILAEGIQWDAATARLYWTDIHGRAFWSCDADGQGVETRALSERLGSFAFDPAGNILCAFESGLFRWDPVRDRLDRLTDFEPDHPTSRLNDGRCDRQGRFVVGGIDEDGQKPTSTLIRYTGRAEVLETGVRCANSIAFSPDGTVMYFADTPTGVIRAYPYDPATGSVGAPRTFSDQGAGKPDGACVDAEGHLWSARWDGYALLRLAPDGAPSGRVDLPVPRVTCACFGGAGLERLYISTARSGMDADALAAAPLSGAIFVARPGPVGLPEARYAHPLF